MLTTWDSQDSVAITPGHFLSYSLVVESAVQLGSMLPRCAAISAFFCCPSPHLRSSFAAQLPGGRRRQRSQPKAAGQSLKEGHCSKIPGDLARFSLSSYPSRSMSLFSCGT
jgi:hypothetical protein